MQFGRAAAAYGIARITRHERTAIVGADLVRAQLVNTVFTQGLKLTVNRTRPVAASRLSARRHFASDVIFGAAVGIVSGRAVTVGRGANRFAVAPLGVPRGPGISFTRVAN